MMPATPGEKLLLQHAQHYGKVLLLESNAGFSKSENEFLFACGNQPGNTGWQFGHFAYDYKNALEALSSSNVDGIKFPDKHFFSPESIIINNTEEIGKTLSSRGAKKQEGEQNTVKGDLSIRARFTKEEYIATVKKVKEHIQRGDVYELNLCMEFYAEDAVINPLEIFRKLNEISCAPFSCFYKLKNTYLLCASPERFIKKRGDKLICQPIKGTARRGNTLEEDELIKKKLRNDLKEQSENVMIVDLVRNDLSRIAKESSVNVDELFGIYTFRQVHQMISTVSCALKANVLPDEILKATFPMGSMTGAPKLRAMELIEKYERTRRGLFSGTVGYITPEGDFDFNVVIRSILYNESEKYVSFQVGSAITANSVPEKEYEECMLKAKAMFEVLEGEKK